MNPKHTKFKVGSAGMTSCRNLFKVGAVAIALGASVMPSKAQLLFQDNFNYQPGSYLTNPNATPPTSEGGWTQAGTYSNARATVGAPFTYSTATTAGSVSQFSGAYGGTGVNHAVTSTAAAGGYTVYLSALSPALKNGSYFNGVNQSMLNLNAGNGNIQFERGTNGNWDFFLKDTSSNSNFSAASTLALTANSLLLLKLDFSAAGFVTVSTDIDPSLTGTPTFTTDGTFALKSGLINGGPASYGPADFNSFNINAYEGTINLGEISVAQTSATVTDATAIADVLNFGAVPEPSTWALMFAGLVGLFGFKRLMRRRSDLV